ncbi:MAG: pyridoxal phosphate-dependent aminotransferase family protein [Gammaproteobacteria bacterium]|nr:pyridoxal phosphate-dependent aminotransferase family protein [Gammaproteobacteria bacterium]
MGLLDKFAEVRATRESLGPIDPTRVVIERLLSPTRAMIRGRETLLAGTNNYMGMTMEPAAIAAGQSALADAGTGTTGSRMANGTHDSHRQLEAELAAFYGYPHAMVFTTGYGANLGVLSALVGPGDAVMLDAHAHASLHDGARMTRADVYSFRHNDATNLDARLRRLGDQATRTLVVVEGLYSVTGDLAPLAEITAVTHRHGALLLVDEAHSVGVIGAGGRGVVETAGVLDQVDFVVGTFSKAFGTTGGFCVSRHAELRLFSYCSRPYMFTASPSPATVASTRAALKLLRDEPQRREHLTRLCTRLLAGLRQLELPVNDVPTPVACVELDSREKALRAWNALLNAGVYVNIMLPPATPGNASLLRLSIGDAYTEADVDELVTKLGGVLGEMNAEAES